MDFLCESSGDWEVVGRDCHTGVVDVDVATAAVAAVRRGRDMVEIAGELGQAS
jgi:hypothetical protein